MRICESTSKRKLISKSLRYRKIRFFAQTCRKCGDTIKGEYGYLQNYKDGPHMAYTFTHFYCEKCFPDKNVLIDVLMKNP